MNKELSKFSAVELIREYNDRVEMAHRIKTLEKRIEAAEMVIKFVNNISLGACKGTVLELVGRKVQIYQLKKAKGKV